MLVPLILGCMIIIFNMGLQCLAVIVMVRYLLRHKPAVKAPPTFATDFKILSTVLAVLFAGHILQFMIWAELFVYLKEFQDFNTAFYHSTVNFASLGYGDIVMSEEWRLLGSLEACNGILMFGLTAGALLAVMTKLFKRYDAYNEVEK
jgi:hypothetical protein